MNRSTPHSPAILVVHPGAELYGSDRVLLESVIALNERGAQVIVALPGHGALVELLKQAGAEVEIIDTLVLRKEYLRLRRLPALLWSGIRGTIVAVQFLRRVRPDAVYVNTVTLPLWPPAARLLGIPVLTHVHEAEGASPRLLRTLLYLPHCISTNVIFNSEFSRAVVSSVYPRLAAHGTTIYNGVAGPPQATAPRHDLDGQLRVLFIGRLSPRKGADLLIEAARILADEGVKIRVDLLGNAFEGYEWYENQLRTAAREAQLTQSVRFHGFHDDIWPYLADADVLVVPSRLDEPFGNTAVEALLAERPVIAGDTSGLREATAGSLSATLVRPDDAAALARALARVAADWTNQRMLAVSDAVLARSSFSPARYRSEIALEVYRTIDPTSHQPTPAFVRPGVG
jgi:glycosyltransferase involved in cell wall biosynthesis